MKTLQGFFLIELLLCLVLLMTISLLLLEQQLQGRDLLQLSLTRSAAERLLNNNSEYLIANLPLINEQKPFKITLSPILHGKRLEIAWGFELPNSNCCKLQRELVTDE